MKWLKTRFSGFVGKLGRLGLNFSCITGGEPGPESIAGYYCDQIGIDVIIHRAVKARGEGSFYRRNQIILKYHKPDLVVCFAPIMWECMVVNDMLGRARAMNIKAKIFDSKSIYRKSEI
jgi:hypothetical protein